MWLGALVVLVGIALLVIDQYDNASKSRRIFNRRITISASPIIILLVGCVLLAYAFGQHSSLLDPFSGKRPIPVSFDEALHAPGDRTVTGSIFFTFGDAHLVEGEIRLLDAAAVIMKRHPTALMMVRSRLYLGGAREDLTSSVDARAAAIGSHMKGAGIAPDRVVYDEAATVTEHLRRGDYRRAYSAVDFIVWWE
ncbi:hypothetical protein ACFPL7_09150 [Dongia soli]|uniref:OmpA family protein n=1 Tax=Dongia soli TaxID=600628 RepID=A0ABU5EAP0_9PROT|nr:hypothetical protein [Dongia soli]MDY0883114.1 hypothetical protein [Dongia soli]